MKQMLLNGLILLRTKPSPTTIEPIIELNKV